MATDLHPSQERTRSRAVEQADNKLTASFPGDVHPPLNYNADPARARGQKARPVRVSHACTALAPVPASAPSSLALASCGQRASPPARVSAGVM